jgi:predicted Fe-S protein YdhL (DUF1289 family)
VDSAVLAALRAYLDGAAEALRLLTLQQAGCADCGRTARELLPWKEYVGDEHRIVAYLGPTCYRRRVDAAGEQASAFEGFRPVRTTVAFQEAGLL